MAPKRKRVVTSEERKEEIREKLGTGVEVSGKLQKSTTLEG
jgi:hypothetical protein